jgi:hypothetical protein
MQSIFTVLSAVALCLVLGFAGALVLMLCVNLALCKWITAIPEITYWQSYGVAVLVGCLQINTISRGVLRCL